ncbi:MAG TPA: glycerol-3-phosphate 1-O-acyltransferase PlsY [Gammaproteobacteria bacterium]|nr:glycerol-3-phosphate 1-O-acyltransferase PlsY [Gammaproteobacteria bacterium]
MIQFVSVLGFMIFAYLLGSIPSAMVVSRLMGLPDPRTTGSGNPGATNMLRVGGKKLAGIVFLGDFLKGIIAVLAAKYFLLPVYIAWVGLAVILGHIFPIFYKFKGGKGVATAAGVFVGLSWQLGLLVILCWIIIVALFRYSSLGALIALVLSPFLTAWLTPQYLNAVIVINLLILWRHQDNIARLIKGRETKIGHHG